MNLTVYLKFSCDIAAIIHFQRALQNDHMIIKKVLTYKLHVFYIACRIVSGGYRDSKAVPRLRFLVGTSQCDSSGVLQAQLKEITPALPRIVMCGDSLRMMQGLKTIFRVPALLLFKIRREGLYVYCGYTTTALWGAFSGVCDLGCLLWGSRLPFSTDFVFVSVRCIS